MIWQMLFQIYHWPNQSPAKFKLVAPKKQPELCVNCVCVKKNHICTDQCGYKGKRKNQTKENIILNIDTMVGDENYSDLQQQNLEITDRFFHLRDHKVKNEKESESADDQN